MNKPMKPATIALLIVAAFGSSSTGAAERFRKLTGAQIHSIFAGMEMTYEVHWGDVFETNGSLTTYSMGHKTAGKWHIQKDELCIERGKDDRGCYQVWLSGKKVELRHEGSSLPLEGVLQKPSVRR